MYDPIGRASIAYYIISTAESFIIDDVIFGVA